MQWAASCKSAVPLNLRKGTELSKTLGVPLRIFDRKGRIFKMLLSPIHGYLSSLVRSPFTFPLLRSAPFKRSHTPCQETHWVTTPPDVSLSLLPTFKRQGAWAGWEGFAAHCRSRWLPAHGTATAELKKTRIEMQAYSITKPTI